MESAVKTYHWEKEERFYGLTHEGAQYVANGHAIVRPDLCNANTQLRASHGFSRFAAWKHVRDEYIEWDAEGVARYLSLEGAEPVQFLATVCDTPLPDLNSPVHLFQSASGAIKGLADRYTAPLLPSLAQGRITVQMRPKFDPVLFFDKAGLMACVMPLKVEFASFLPLANAIIEAELTEPTVWEHPAVYSRDWAPVQGFEDWDHYYNTGLPHYDMNLPKAKGNDNGNDLQVD